MKSLLLTFAALICGAVFTADALAQIILKPDTRVRQTDSRVANTSTQPTTYELRCRGASREQNTTPSFSVLSSRPSTNGNSIVTMAMDFERGSKPSGAKGEGLKPGQCTWVDRQYNGLEPTRIRFETQANAQLAQILHGSTVDRSPTAAERYPDQQTIPEYMSDSNHFWAFYAYNTNQGYLEATGHQAWKPSLVASDRITDRDILTGPIIVNRDGILTSRDRVSDSVLRPLPREVYEPPILDNQVRVLVRFSKEYGSAIPYGGSTLSPCNAFSVMGATVFEPVPGGFGSDREVGGSYARHTGPINDGSNWICSATIYSLPLNQDLKVYIRVHSDPLWRTAAWTGGSNTQPPPGYERTITPGFQTVRLTPSKTSDIVIFNMVYAPLPSAPR